MSGRAGRVPGRGHATGSGPVRSAPVPALLATPLARVVTGVALAGVLAVAGISWLSRWSGWQGPAVGLGGLGGWTLAATLVAFTCVSELVAVRLRHRDAVEEITLLDPMVLLNAVLLPPPTAVAVSLAGLTAAYAVRRRALIKSVFNLGTYAAGASVLALFLRVLAGPDGAFDIRLVLAVSTGAAGFVAVNVGCMSLLLSRLGAGSVRFLIRQDLSLSLFTLAATTGVAATALTIAVHAPVFLPFIALPAIATTYAYRAAATESEERQRSGHVLAFSRVLAGSPGREAAVAGFLRLARDGFFADHALVVFDSGEVVTLDAPASTRAPGAPGAPGDAPPGRAADPAPVTGRAEGTHRALLALCGDDAALVPATALPSGWGQAMLAPLEAGGTRVGAVAIGWVQRDGRRSQRLAMFASLVSSLAAALSRAENLARLVEETGKLRAVVDQSSDGILVLDGLGRVVVWNPALQALSGLGADAATGRPLGELCDVRDTEGAPVDPFAAGCSMLSPGSPQATVELQIVRRDGEWRSVRCAHAGIFDDDGLLVRDIVNVHDLTRERQVDRLKSDFIATVSHELRTPVTPIKGYADMLRKRWDTMPEEKRLKALDAIADRAGHLGRLVEDLLLASHISSDNEPTRSIVRTTADLNDLAVRAGEDFVSARGRLRIRPAPRPVPVDCDTTRAVQILTNLLSNALKYSPEDAVVEVAVDVAEVVAEVDRTGTVTVLDHGRGIPSDQLDRVFDKFHRVEDPMVMSTGGSGLGLYIARHLARAMDGDITVTSTLGEGSRFTLYLPLAAADQQGIGA